MRPMSVSYLASIKQTTAGEPKAKLIDTAGTMEVTFQIQGIQNATEYLQKWSEKVFVLTQEDEK